MLEAGTSSPSPPVNVQKDVEECRVEDLNTQGTLYQLKLGGKAQKRHFFSPLEQDVADAVHKDAETVVYSQEEEVSMQSPTNRNNEFSDSARPEGGETQNQLESYVIGDWQSISSVSGHSIAFHISQDLPRPRTDRTNIGNVHVIPAFNENFGVTNNQKWTLALSVFYIGYCLLEMPANVLQRRIGANRVVCSDEDLSFFMSLSFWGLSSLSFVYAKGYVGLLVLRVLLGIGEAGYYAGMVYYLSFWYTRHELAMRISICMTGTYPGAISGLIAFGLVRAHTSVLKGWQFLYMIEAIPTIVMAALILMFLPSFPFAATFLTPREKAIAQARMDRDQKPTSHGGMTGWEGFKAVVNDVNAWLLVIIYAGCEPLLLFTCMKLDLTLREHAVNVGTATITYFLPTLVDELGYSDINAQGMTVAPYVVGWFLVIFQAWHSDRTRDRGWHIVASSLISFVGYVILATSVQKSAGAGYFALFLVVAGNFSLFPLVIASPQIYFDSYDDFRKGHGISAACLFATAICAFALRTRLTLKNKKNRERLAAMSQDEKNGLSDDAEIWDNDPRYVFMV
ncbi:predicted protein [Postia placenta Mad-698-R]|nr:predicted protein [Postia placenta Mad-698-R]